MIHRQFNSLTGDSIKALVLDAYASRSDTSARFLEWAMTELLRHPSGMKKLQNERRILSGKQDIREDDLEKMSFQ